MIHIMKLKEQYFNYIKYGTKEYEIRLNDEKRKNIKKGDFIEFQKEPFLEEKILIMVGDILRYDNFDELLNNINIELLADSNIIKEELNIDLEKIYPTEKQKKYGIVAIIWDKTNRYSGIPKTKYDEYYEKCDNAVAFEIERATLYDTPKFLNDYKIKVAPQSYVYIKEGFDQNEWK